MISKRFYVLFPILLLVISGLLLNSGCDNTSSVPLREALQGRYTITTLNFTTHEWETVAYLELTEGRYSLMPNESSNKLIEEVAINFFAENPTGTYTIIGYYDGITENTTLEDLDENNTSILLAIDFDSPNSGQGTICDFDIGLNTNQWEHEGPDKKPSLYLMPVISILVSYEISKPWEE
jgi:hypothetical protein